MRSPLFVPAAAVVILATSLVIVVARTRADAPPLAVSFFGTFALSSYASITCHYIVRHGLRIRLVLLGMISACAAYFAADPLSAVVHLTALKMLLLAAGAAGLAAYLFETIRADGNAETQRSLIDLAEALIVPLAVD